MNHRLLLARLSDVADFLSWQRQIASVPGWLDDLEGWLLHLLAAEGPGAGTVVEIGSYMGRSTCWLASGSLRAGREKVVAVDHFKGSPEHQAGGRNESCVVVPEGSTFAHFQQNLQRLSLLHHVVPRVGSSEDAARTWNQPVRLLFIDADHSYEESRKDFLLWAPFIVPAGLVCFHDIEVWPGVTRFYKELLSRSAELQEVAVVRSVRVVHKSA